MQLAPNAHLPLVNPIPERSDRLDALMRRAPDRIFDAGLGVEEVKPAGAVVLGPATKISAQRDLDLRPRRAHSFAAVTVTVMLVAHSGP